MPTTFPSREQTWQEIESRVHTPGKWLPATAGTLFVSIGIAGLVFNIERVPPQKQWIVGAGAAVFTLFGLLALAFVVKRTLWPASVLHAAPERFPEIPAEPVVREGAFIMGHLSHEFLETEDEWRLRPSVRQRQIDRIVFFGFGVPFLIFAAGLFSWVAHEEWNVGSWTVAILAGTTFTLICGGSAFGMIWLMMKSARRRLSTLLIPKTDGDLILENIGPIEGNGVDVAEFFGLNYPKTEPVNLAIPRENVVAVQLCPWRAHFKNSHGSLYTWAVQGLIVVSSSAGDEYERYPFLVTGSMEAAAILMQQLAEVTRVPYLFHGDEAGWREEFVRAKTRPPLKSGGMMG